MSIDAVAALQKLLKLVIAEMNGQWQDTNSTPHRKSSTNKFPKSKHILLIDSELVRFLKVG
jgi:hypothetical protein